MWSRIYSVTAIEFVGGPVDGLVKAVDFPPQPFFGVMTGRLARKRAWKNSLWRLIRRRPPPLVSLSVYEFRSRGAENRYRYLGSQAVAEREVALRPGFEMLERRLSPGS